MDAATRRPEYHAWLRQPSDWKRLINLQWGAQLTVEFLTSLQSRDKALELLRSMRAAGCTYIYFGIESLAPSIMAQVHKNLNKEAWADKVRAALELVKEAGIRTGASVLFGLDGETRDTIDETIAGVATPAHRRLARHRQPQHPDVSSGHRHHLRARHARQAGLPFTRDKHHAPLQLL